MTKLRYFLLPTCRVVAVAVAAVAAIVTPAATAAPLAANAQQVDAATPLEVEGAPLTMTKRDALESAETLRRLASELLDGNLEGERKADAARSYVAEFPDTFEGFQDLLGIRDSSLPPHYDADYYAPLHGAAGIYGELFFSLFDYMDKRDFVRKAVGITIGAHWQSGVSDEYARALGKHYRQNFDAYLDYLAGKREETVAFLRFFRLDLPHIEPQFNADYLCLGDHLYMRLCAASGIISAPFLDDFLAADQCEREPDACDRAAFEDFKIRLAAWVESDGGAMDDAFEPNSGNAASYVPVFYMAKRYLAGAHSDLPLVEAKLYTNHPGLGLVWLIGQTREGQARDGDEVKHLGRELFVTPCRGRTDDAIMESVRVGKNLITQLRERLEEDQKRPFSLPVRAFTFGRHERKKMQALLEQLEALEPEDVADARSYCAGILDAADPP